MKLFLMRHSHTNPIDLAKQSDLERELSKNGICEAFQTASFLQNYLIDKVLVSNVGRALATYNILARFINTEEVNISHDLYQKNISNIIDLISNKGNNSVNLLILGHFPSIFELAKKISKKDSKNYEYLVKTFFPTSRVIVIDFPFLKSWSLFNNQYEGDIIEIFTPKIWSH